MNRKYAIVFANAMDRPAYIICDHPEKFILDLRDLLAKYGDVELIYRVY